MRSESARLAGTAALLCCAFIAGCRGDPVTLPPIGADLECAITRVTDGDTIRVDCLDARVRLLLIDAPEVAHDDGQGGITPNECFGPEAKRYLETRLPQGAKVRLVAGVRDRDRFDRYLRYVFLGDELLDATLVREGYAIRFRDAEDRRYLAEISDAEDEAREARRGLWACPARK